LTVKNRLLKSGHLRTPGFDRPTFDLERKAPRQRSARFDPGVDQLLPVRVVQCDRYAADQLDGLDRVLPEFSESSVYQRRRQRQDLQVFDDVCDPKLGRVAHQPEPVLVLDLPVLGRLRDEVIGEKGCTGCDRN